VDVHEHDKPKKALDAIVAGLTDPRKLAAFTAVVRGHRKFMRRHAARWFDPPKGSWVEGGIVVHVNPELGLEIRGVPHVVKLYFKAERMPKRNVATITRLMATSPRSSRACRPHVRAARSTEVAGALSPELMIRHFAALGRRGGAGFRIEPVGERARQRRGGSGAPPREGSAPRISARQRRRVLLTRNFAVSLYVMTLSHHRVAPSSYP